MTTTGEFFADGEDFEAPSYPSAFGITFTPQVSGVCVGVAGLALAAYLGTQFVLPTYTQYQTYRESIAQKELDLQQQVQTAKRVNQIVASLNRAKAENTAVRSLFSSQKALDTLLLDLNRVVVGNSAQMLEFTPDYAVSGPVTDSSLGPELNNKIKRQVTSVAFRGTFSQTLKIMQAIDRSQTVLVLQDLTVELPKQSKQQEALVPRQNLVKSSFKLYAYVPMTAEESSAAEAANEANQEQENPT